MLRDISFVLAVVGLVISLRGMWLLVRISADDPLYGHVRSDPVPARHVYPPGITNLLLNQGRASKWIFAGSVRTGLPAGHVAVE